jgi:hypothetical protein
MYSFFSNFVAFNVMELHHSEMTMDQRRAVKLYSYASMISFALVTTWLIYVYGKGLISKTFCATPEPVGDPSTITFRDVNGISAYIPQITRKGLLFPIICCDISSVPLRHFPMIMNSTFTDMPDPKVIYSIL